MNLWLRLLWLLLATPFRDRLAVPDGVLRLWFHVGLLDLDTNGHMNNGRYLTLMDLGRMDLILRSGLWRAVLANKWTPVLSAASIRYRRELRLFRRFRLDSRIVAWGDSWFVMEQRFIARNRRGEEMVAAVALLRGGLYDRRAKAFVPVAQLLATVGVNAASPEPPEEVRAFLAAEAAMKHTARDAPKRAGTEAPGG
ncbi:thioesterase family protein [Chelatococcus daeguensis]|uniref:thioesterase family protein n=1 Tax=Chelatococcus daeguensis TaxID=444444 RepID=UPI0007ABE1CE|nr:thioesterase family protein [Chelatococcus daeguensis]KZE36263.1 thioesterase [Chelatococcus daeguensis]MBM3084260.1 thioesterase family protein [Chelatococcus daeguensis]